MFVTRIQALRKGDLNPARPTNALARLMTSATALTREITNVSLPALRIFGWTPQSPSLGSISLVVANAVILIVLGFYKLPLNDYESYQNIAYRWGFLTMDQFPLVFLLAGKESIIGFFTGHSYERLNWLHRWVARCMLLTATLHMGYWFADWAPYDYIGYQMKNDKTFTQTGFAAWIVLVWIVFSSWAPIRNLSYELFVLQHLLSFTAFLTMVFIHTPASDHGWLWVPVGLFFFDRVVRAAWMAFNNLAIFHSKKARQSSLWACQAELTPLPGRMTRVTVRNPPKTWKPGQHVFLSMQSIVPLQTHPFSIASIPSDGKMEFVVKAHKGGTKRFLDYAQKRTDLPSNNSRGPMKATIPCTVSNTYGSMRSLRQFDSVILFAGSTGATFTVPLLRDIVQQWKLSTAAPSHGTRGFWNTPNGAITRRIRFIWAVKAGEHVSWFAEQLRQAMHDTAELRKQGLDVRLRISVYVTCDEAFTSDWNSVAASQNGSTSQPKPGQVMERAVASSRASDAGDEKKTHTKEQGHDIREVDPRSDSTTNASKACGPDGTCCCKVTVEDEDTAPNACTCNCSREPLKLSKDDIDPVLKLAEHVTVVSGRPCLRTITRRVLEKANGESAVVSCGPRGMNNDVRRAVVSLSDERAAGRATGAGGVWFWGEGFGW